MSSEIVRNIKARLLLSSRFIWRRKGLWLRAILCWLIGFLFIIADREHDYDLRLKIRGEQPADSEIVLIHISADEWQKWLNKKSSDFFSRDSNYITDSFYWDSKAWAKLLNIILREKPIAIGVSPYFGENITIQHPNETNQKIFSDSRIIWASQLDDEGRILPSRFAKKFSLNSGLNEYSPDRDGIIRRFNFSTVSMPHFAFQIARKAPNAKPYNWDELKNNIPVINFRGAKKTFIEIKLTELTDPSFPLHLLHDKIVLIGLAEFGEHKYRTPTGDMSRIELVANLIDNIKNDRWIKRPHPIVIGLILLFFVIASAWMTSTYPQFLAFFSISFINLLYATISIWIFDTFYFWLPISSVLLTSTVTYIIFLSFQLTLKEYLNIQLETEREFLYEVEQLKNNFLSLISHDLKTPIAKIQAICDRLIAQHTDEALNQDLTSLREVATELHRYIRTILQITRVESRDFRISKDATDINEIIEAVVLQLEPLAKNKKINLSMALEPMFLIEVDQVLIHEVILNLVENAIKYSPEEGQVKISSQEVDDQVIIMVEDTGPGIPEQEQAQIFDKFYRGELGKSQPKGSGLGLYLVKYFVELHNGRIFLDSSAKQGTKVGFTLPITDSQNTEDSNYENLS
ncbi:MAG: CHASE2 domain-containing protein [Bdellovibrionales bacterium]|nr:CHASE2 domain-containing protein [Bdellovibrionales bacterium]